MNVIGDTIDSVSYKEVYFNGDERMKAEPLIAKLVDEGYENCGEGFGGDDYEFKVQLRKSLSLEDQTPV